MLFRGPRSSRLHGGVRATALLLGLAAVASACSSSGFTYVSSSDRNSYFKVPADWRFYDKRDLLVAAGQSLSAGSNAQLSWLIGYDADPDPSVDHIISLADAPKYPVIQATVESLPPSVRDQLSLYQLRNWVYPVERLIQANEGEVVAYKDVTFDGGLHGIRMTFDVVLGGLGNVSANNEVIRVSQVSVVNPSTQKLYLFVIRCESHCYRDNKSLLDQILDSWTVKER